ncbi:hypothetical protein [Negadavirga shengliensis]|uniref:Uncharacterized protein n=1 Tax=Negadavirga shengliensis TaxID=1389218 RepID=A0ABV9T505_9BACT
MTKNGLDIQTISTKRTDKQADRVLLLGQVTEEKEKALPSHFLKFLLASRTNGTLGFARHKSRPFAKPKEPFYDNAPKDFELNNLTLKVEVL